MVLKTVLGLEFLYKRADVTIRMCFNRVPYTLLCLSKKRRAMSVERFMRKFKKFFPRRAHQTERSGTLRSSS